MEHDYVKYLREHNPTVRLLRLDNAPLIISFLFRAFKSQNRLSIPGNELTSNLSDFLFYLNQEQKKPLYPRPAEQYLENWANDGFLRKYYEANNDEPVFDLTPATEKALEWIQHLEQKEFVGTESRLLQIFSILRDIVFYSTEDPAQRMMKLEQQKTDIDREIEKLKKGKIEKMGTTKIKERFTEVEETAQRLLSDFRQIEQNFRELDKNAREQQIDSTLSKGKVLDDIFHVHDLIWDTDQGRSFKAFWEYLMCQSKQQELEELIGTVLQLPEVQEVKKGELLERLKVNLVEAGEKVYNSNGALIEQLRKFLDGKLYLENKRILEIINGIEKQAILIKEYIPKVNDFLTIEGDPDMDFVMERPFFKPPEIVEMTPAEIEQGEANADTTALYQQLHINPETLKTNIRILLASQSQITLKQVTEQYPVEKGLVEIITYFDLATKDPKAVIHEEKTETISIVNKDTQKRLEITLPQTIFCK